MINSLDEDYEEDFEKFSDDDLVQVKETVNLDIHYNKPSNQIMLDKSLQKIDNTQQQIKQYIKQAAFNNQLTPPPQKQQSNEEQQSNASTATCNGGTSQTNSINSIARVQHSTHLNTEQKSYKQYSPFSKMKDQSPQRLQQYFNNSCLVDKKNKQLIKPNANFQLLPYEQNPKPFIGKQHQPVYVSSLKVNRKQPESALNYINYKMQQQRTELNNKQNNSFQPNVVVKDCISTGQQREDRRSSQGGTITHNSSQKQIFGQNSPRYFGDHQKKESIEKQKDMQQKNIKEMPLSRNSLKASKQTSQRQIGFPRPPSFKPQNSSIEEIPPSVPSSISAKCWAVIDGDSGELLAGKNEHSQKEIASLTKIMTCWVSIQLSKKFNIKIDDTFFEVSYYASNIGGTTATLCTGDQLSIRDLLYGLMLPSGNDAAVTLAENFGDYAEDEEDMSGDDYLALQVFRDNIKYSSMAQLDYFLSQMNYWANTYGLTKTNFVNPHGLANDRNKSTAFDIGMLCYRIMKDPLFSKIVSTKIYFSEVVDEEGFSKELFWENTNKLLYKGFYGIKTGITPRSGPCVVEHYKDEKRNIIIVLLNSKSQDERWIDTMKIVNWVKGTSYKKI